MAERGQLLRSRVSWLWFWLFRLSLSVYISIKFQTYILAEILSDLKMRLKCWTQDRIWSILLQNSDHVLIKVKLWACLILLWSDSVPLLCYNFLSLCQVLVGKLKRIKNYCQAHRVLSHVLVNSWLTPGQVYKTSREDPEIGSVMQFFLLKIETCHYG